MRVFSVASALLLAITSFAAAAPAADSSATVPDGSIQDIINIVSSANVKLQPLDQQLSTALQASNQDQVGSVISQINTIVSSTAEQLQGATSGINLTSATLSVLIPVVSTLVNLLVSILSSLLRALSGALAGTASGTLASVSDLLASVNTLVTLLGPFVISTAANILGPVLTLVNSLSGTIQSFLPSA